MGIVQRRGDYTFMPDRGQWRGGSPGMSLLSGAHGSVFGARQSITGYSTFLTGKMHCCAGIFLNDGRLFSNWNHYNTTKTLCADCGRAYFRRLGAQSTFKSGSYLRASENRTCRSIGSEERVLPSYPPSRKRASQMYLKRWLLLFFFSPRRNIILSSAWQKITNHDDFKTRYTTLPHYDAPIRVEPSVDTTSTRTIRSTFVVFIQIPPWTAIAEANKLRTLVWSVVILIRKFKARVVARVAYSAYCTWILPSIGESSSEIKNQ